MSVKIITDSISDLPKELIEKYDITVLPLYVTVDGTTYRDGVDITADEMLAMTEASGTPKTAALNIQDYLDAFSEALLEADEIVHFCISGTMSACYQNACVAAEELGHIHVINTENLSTGAGHLVLDACLLAREGKTGAEIAAIMNERKKKVDASFVLTTLEYLRRGGRCTALAAMGANLLRLHPCISVKDGAMGVGKKYRGNMKNCLLDYVKDKLAAPDTIDPRRIFITDSGIDEEIRQAVHEAVLELVPFEEVIHSRAGCTVSCHCGPGTLGILFYRK